MHTMAAAVLLVFAPLAGPAARSPEQLLKQARQLEDQRKTARAAELYKAFLKAHAQHSQVSEAHYRLARCLDEMGLVDEAAGHYEKAIAGGGKRFRHRRDAFYALGKLLGSLKNYDRAVKVLEQLLAEGAGLYEDEVLSLCGGYYAVLKKYDEAAAKLNILKRRPESRYAEPAAFKLAVLWLRAERLDLGADAVQDLALRYPRNPRTRGLMLELADLFRRKRHLREATALCQQLRSRFPKAREAQAASYVLGLCYRDTKEFQKAVEVFDALARPPANRKNGLASEALVQSADILRVELGQPEKAVTRYEEAAKLIREVPSERRDRILEHCYFNLAEHHYRKKNWSVALEYYVLLRRLGTKLNVLPRILKCQAELEEAPQALGSAADVAIIKKKIEENPGTFVAAEAEVFLIDLDLNKARKANSGLQTIVARYQDVLARYPREVLRQHDLDSYVYTQLGCCYARGETKAEWRKAVAAFEKALEVAPRTPYKTEVLENLAQVADLAGDRRKAMEVYQRLFAATARKVEAGKATAEERERLSDYLRCILSRAEKEDSVDEAIRLAHEIIEKSGVFSEAARHAMFYLGDLYYLKKDFSTAAKTYRSYIKVYGPKLNPKGDVANPPWQPSRVDERVLQVYEAAARVAHCWRMQGHFANMVKAYQWSIENFTHKNKFNAEAHYWLALELAKGKKAQDPENRREMAEALWKNVVNPSLDFATRDFERTFYPWVHDPETGKYAKAAILRSAKTYSELGEHERAAAIFKSYLDLYAGQRTPRRRRRGPGKPDPQLRVARYALGREYIALGDIDRLVECYRPYLDGHRDDKFRVSGLLLLGYHAGRAERHDQAIEAYATLLDEYGDNKFDPQGEPVPVPQNQRLRRGRYNWNGIRLPPPKNLDLGQSRFALGFLYWSKEDWASCVRTLKPFLDDPRLFENKARPKALYMVARSYYNDHDYARALDAARRLLHDHPGFEATEEVYAFAARCCVETGKWSDIQGLCAKFIDRFPRSAHRPHMDLYAARALLGLGRTEEGLARLTSIAESETYEDVKALAFYYIGTHIMALPRPNLNTALVALRKSVGIYATERSCLAAAQCAMRLKRWAEARDYLQRAIRQFPAGDKRTIEQARSLLPSVLKELARATPGKKGGKP